MSTRRQNEKKFGNIQELLGEGRIYWLDVKGRQGWMARNIKEADANENTVRFWQEIYDDDGKLVEVHHKFPADRGHEKVEN